MEHRLGLEDYDADREDGPGVLRNLIFVQALAQTQDGDHEQQGVEREGHHHVLLQHEARQGVRGEEPRVALHEVANAAGPGKERRHEEPGPLDGPEERQAPLRRLALPDANELAEDEALQGEDQDTEVP